jgi:hypothetical protein
MARATELMGLVGLVGLSTRALEGGGRLEDARLEDARLEGGWMCTACFIQPRVGSDGF